MKGIKTIGVLLLIIILIGFFLAQPLLNTLILFLPKNVIFVALTPFDGFNLIMWCGIAVSTSFIAIGLFAWLWFTNKDILFKHEKKWLLKNILPILFLFIFGFSFGEYLYFLIMLPYFIQLNLSLGLTNYWSMSTVILNGVSMGITLGIAFQLPIILRGLIKFNIIKKELLRKNRIIFYVIAYIVAAIITPTPDLITTFIVLIPLIIFYEISLI